MGRVVICFSSISRTCFTSSFAAAMLEDGMTFDWGPCGGSAGEGWKYFNRGIAISQTTLGN